MLGPPVARISFTSGWRIKSVRELDGRRVDPSDDVLGGPAATAAWSTRLAATQVHLRARGRRLATTMPLRVLRLISA